MSAGRLETDLYFPYCKVNNNNRLNIAIVTLILPGFPGKSGGEIRDGHIIGYLSSKHNVEVYSLNNFPVEDGRYKSLMSQVDQVFYPEMICREHPEHAVGYSKTHAWQQLRVKLGSKQIYLPFGELPYEVEGFLSTFRAFTRSLLQAKLDENRYDVLMITPQVNPALLGGLRIPHRCKTVFATYDAEFIRYQRLKQTQKSIWSRITFPFEIRKAVNMEKQILSTVDGVIAVSELDQQAFIKEYGIDERRVLNIENGVDTTYFSKPNHTKQKDSFDVIYVGNMGYAPNSQAVTYFLEEIFPHILKQQPNTRFLAVGANADSLKKHHNGSNIIITGEVPDVRAYLFDADVVCIPLQTGSGTKYKVLEALSAEKPVVTTSMGSEGINVKDGVHLFVRDNAQDVAEAILYCFKHRSEATEMGLKGRQFVIDNHEWRSVLPRLEKWFGELLDKGK